MQSLHYSNGSPAPSQINLEQYRNKLFRYSLRITRNRDDAEDLTQETFIRAAGSLGSLKNPDRIWSWLYRIASNINADKFRKLSEESASNLKFSDGDRDSRYVDLDYIGETVSPENHLDGKLFMDECLSGLKQEHRAILELKAENWPYGDISIILGIPIGTVRSRLHNARKIARERLLEEGIV